MIKSYAELDAFLKELPQAPDRVRVFRGQTRKFPKMQPTELRDTTGPQGNLVWDSYTQVLAGDLLRQSQSQMNPDDISLLLLWVHVIAQHYGPGTSYLDVSHSVEVALWFALHDTDSTEVSHVLGPPGPLDPKRDKVAREQYLSFHPSETGFLFVFDVPKWDGTGLPEHGQLVDLAEADPIIASSERLRAQKACLITADAENDGGDLKRFYACEPIAVGRPMAGVTLLSSPSDTLFPDPAIDDWYRRFLWLPFVTQLDYAGRTVRLARPWPVTVYMGTTLAAAKRLLTSSVRLTPLATNIARLGNPSLPPAAKALVPWANYQITEATPILLEVPLIFASAPADSDQWNHGILAGDMSDDVEAIDFQTGQACGSVNLRNVFLEFSLLETAGWERVEDPDNKSDLIRALWLMRDQNHFVIHLVVLSFPGQQQSMVGPFFFRLDTTGRQLEWWSPENQGWTNVDGSEPVSKLLFVALTILRAVSPGAKADAFPIMVADTSEGRHIFVGVRRQAASLVRIAAEPGGNVWYALKEANSDAPFFFDPSSSIGQLEFQDAVPWPEIDPRLIRNAVP